MFNEQNNANTELEVRRAENNKRAGEKKGKLGRAGWCDICQGKVAGGGNSHGKPSRETGYSIRCSVPRLARILVPTPEYDSQRKQAKLQMEKVVRGAPVKGLTKGKRGSRPPKKKDAAVKGAK